MTTISPLKVEKTTTTTWSTVCKVEDLVANSGVCVLLDKKQIAIFAISDSANDIQLYACDNYDPLGKANVLSRGILCSIAGQICICSPLYKQHFSLVDGICLEDEQTSISVYPIKIVANEVFVSAPALAAA